LKETQGELDDAKSSVVKSKENLRYLLKDEAALEVEKQRELDRPIDDVLSDGTDGMEKTGITGAGFTGITGSTGVTGVESTGTTGATGATGIGRTGATASFANELLESATAGEIRSITGSATLISAAEMLKNQENGAKSDAWKAFKIIETEKDLIKNLTVHYQMALTDKLHAIKT
jgi:hypothetical protein